MKHFPLFLAVALLIIVGACQKELSKVSLNNKPDDLMRQLEEKQPAGRKFTITASQPTILSVDKGFKISIPKNAFVTQSGQPVSGNIEIELKVLTTAADIILNNKFTQFNSEPIQSGGAFFIRSTQNNQPLKLSPGSRINVKIPLANAPLPGMQVFNGEMRTDTANNNSFTWVPNTNTGNTVSVVADSLVLNNYLMEFDSIGWINCDRLFNEPIFQMHAMVENLNEVSSATAIIHLTGMLSALRAWTKPDGSFLFSAPSRQATIIVIGKKDEQFYADFRAVQLQTNLVPILRLVQITEAELTRKLNELR